VYTEIIPDVKGATLSEIIRGRADIESVIHIDGRGVYDGLVYLGYEKHLRVNHDENVFSAGDGKSTVLKVFGVMPSIGLQKFNGIEKENFIFHLKETEFRFNNRGKDLYKILLKMFGENPF